MQVKFPTIPNLALRLGQDHLDAATACLVQAFPTIPNLALWSGDCHECQTGQAHQFEFPTIPNLALRSGELAQEVRGLIDQLAAFPTIPNLALRSAPNTMNTFWNIHYPWFPTIPNLALRLGPLDFLGRQQLLFLVSNYSEFSPSVGLAFRFHQNRIRCRVVSNYSEFSPSVGVG